MNRSTSINKTNNNKYFGHEALLNHFMKAGKEVTLICHNGKNYTGRVVAFDNYTVSLETTVSMSEDPVNIVFFKSSIIGFFSTDKN